MYKINEEKLILDWEEKRKPISDIPWTDRINSTPIDDMRNWQRVLGDICGIYGNIIEFNICTFNYLSQSNELRKWGSDITNPSDISDLLWGRNVKIIINEKLDNGKVIIKSVGEYLPEYYKDIEATVF